MYSLRSILQSSLSAFLLIYFCAYLLLRLSAFALICICAYLHLCLSAFVLICICAYLLLCLSTFVLIYFCAYLHLRLSAFALICFCAYLLTYNFILFHCSCESFTIFLFFVKPFSKFLFVFLFKKIEFIKNKYF